MPVGLLLGIVLALGRLYHDSEMTAAQACGAGSRTVLVPVLGFTAVLAVLLALLSLQVAPAAAGRMLELRSEALRAGQFAPISRGQVPHLWRRQHRGVRAGRRSGRHAAPGVRPARPAVDKLEIALAQRATHAYSEDGDLQVITLYDGERYEGIPGERKFRIVRFAENTIPGAPAARLSDGAMALEGVSTACARGSRTIPSSAPSSTGASRCPIMARGHGRRSPCRWRGCGRARAVMRAWVTRC